MDGMAKSAEQVGALLNPPEPRKSETDSIERLTGGVDMEIYRFFNVNPFESTAPDHLKKIHDWAISDSTGIGDALRKLRNLEMKLGQPSVGETRISKIYNFVRTSDSIRTTQAKMNEELELVKAKHKATLLDLQTQHKEKVVALDKEITRLEKDYREATRKYRINVTNQTNNIRKEFGRQLAELKSMREAYKGGK